VDLVNVHYAKTHLSRLLDKVAAGEEILLGKNGKPVAKLVPVEAVARRPGRLKGKIKIAAGFDAPLPKDVRKAFGGELE
jgi:prevent-host-death family protein